MARQQDAECGAFADFGGDVDEAAGLLDDAVDGGEAETCPLPPPFVVKNGSKIFSITSGGMPLPVSETSSSTYSPGLNPCSRNLWLSGSVTFAVRIESLPPSGIASRALTARFTITCSSWFRSALIGQTSRP